MNFKKSRILMWIGFGIGIFIMVIGLSFENEKTISGFMIVGAVVFFTALIQAFIYYTCPHCGYSLMSVRGEIPEYCPKCGNELKPVIGIIDSDKKA